MVISPQAPHGEPLPDMVCADPESGTDHFLKDVTIKDVYAIFDLLLEVIFVYIYVIKTHGNQYIGNFLFRQIVNSFAFKLI